MRELLEEGVLAPHGLGHHLGQLHGTQGRGEPPVAAQDVHTCLDQPNGLHRDIIINEASLNAQSQISTEISASSHKGSLHIHVHVLVVHVYSTSYEGLKT